MYSEYMGVNQFSSATLIQLNKCIFQYYKSCLQPSAFNSAWLGQMTLIHVVIYLCSTAYLKSTMFFEDLTT